jgi:predicted lipid-binding transport protein (Tim44 family)
VGTGQTTLRVTREHPFYVGDGTFKTLEALKVGDRIFAVVGGALREQMITSLEMVSTPTRVYNLQTDHPNTYFANGIAVHNKGGGGGGGGFGGGGFYGGGSSGGGSGDPTILFIFIGAFVVIFLIAKAAQNKKAADEDLDYVYSRFDIERKAGKTRKLLEFLARVDQTMAPDKLEAQAKSTFLELQKCWQARNYDPMKPLLMPDLYAEHCSQLSGLIANHEIDMISNLNVEHVDIVNVRYPQKENDREFTALITATARDYYVDDRTQEFLRGDQEPARFQEFWTFHRQGGAWLLREIDQSRESDALKEENFFEQFTDTGLNQVYDETAGKEGPAGPWLEKETLDKSTRIERLLNFLVQTDKLWNRQAMLERARQVFLDVTLAREKGDPAAVPTAELFPDVATNLQGELVRLGGQGTQLEFRNLCVRKAELILVRNFSDNSKDEFTVRISAHAQRAVRRNNLLISQDADVTPFVEFWTFGRLDNEWKLKEVLPPARGGELVATENVDEGSSPEQLQWYYKQTRAT